MNFFFQANNYGCLILGFVLAFVITNTLLFTFSSLVVLGLILIFIITLIRPSWSLFFIAASLPLFGDRPGSLQQFYQLGLLSTICFALALKNFSFLGWHNFSKIHNNPVLSCLSLFVLSAILSLLFIPNQELQKLWFAFVPFATPEYLELLPRFLRKILRSSEEQVVYSFIAVTWTVLAYLFATLLYQHITFVAPKDRSRIVLSLLVGLGAALLFGLLDYFKVISLLSLRHLDPVVNVGGLQFRMQSFFAHSGWFAEFLTFNIPFVLALLFLKIKRRLAIGLILGVLVVGEVCLVLTFQRGGWLAYPITLLVVWISVYFFESEKGQLNSQLLRKKVLKVFISIPLTILISLFVVLLIFKTGILSSDYTPEFEQYAQRFKDISRASDRTQFFEAAFKLASLSPIFGNGAESFAWMYEREFSNPRGLYFKQIILPLHGSAHNVFYQILAGQGFFGLAALLLCCFVAIFYGFQQAFSIKPSRSDRIIALATACSIIAFLIYGNVQEFFYVQSLQVNLFIVFAILASLLPPNDTKGSYFRFAGLRLFCLAILAQIFWLMLNSFVQFAPVSKVQKSYGCLPVKKAVSGFKTRDCGNNVRVLLPVDGRIQIQNIIESEQALQLKISCVGKVLKEYRLAKHEKIKLNLAAPADLSNCLQADRVWLNINSDQFYFKPVADEHKKYRMQPLAFRLLEKVD